MNRTVIYGAAIIVELFNTFSVLCNAQSMRVTAPQRIATVAIAPVAGETQKPSVPSNLSVAGGSNHEIDLVWDASTESGGTINMYRIYLCESMACNTARLISTSPANSYTVKNLAPSTAYLYAVRAVDANGNSSDLSKILRARTADSQFACWLIPARSNCMNFGPDNEVDKTTKINGNINSFYQTSGSFSFLNQVKSIYNQASGSTTVAADLASLNFANGIQVTVGTNVQAGSSGATVAGSGSVPTLAASGAGQATQNVLYGGTFVASELYPLAAAGSSKWGSPGGIGYLVDFVLKEGADVQNFKSGSDVSVVSPPFHGSGQIEGYLQYNSINLAPNSQHLAGSLFFGGSYGYNYMSRGYARDYGFGREMHHGIGQISFGILINGVAKITVSRAFGPSQTYIDSTSNTQTTVNNFKSWSFGITYQSAPAK